MADKIHGHPNGHSYPQMLSAEETKALQDPHGNVKIECARCKASYVVTPNFVDPKTQFLVRKLVSADLAARLPCPAVL